ncbi:MAG: hypothetical protein M1827_001544 [Pycnora praestabilis]|nr:MAG: hypothetical protein M1827_001544 [Pycnora praestabilis]
MPSGPPIGFLNLEAASTRIDVDVNIIGVVNDFMPPCRSRGSDYVCTFTIHDTNEQGYYSDLKIRFFNKSEDGLPTIQGTGDIMMLQRLKARRLTDSIPKTTTTNVKPKYLSVKGTHPPKPQEIAYAIELCNAQDRRQFTVPLELDLIKQTATTLVASPREKFSLVKDVQIDKFYDIIGQVVKAYSDNGRLEVYVTDYTSNNLLYNYEWGRGGSDSAAREGDEFGYVPRKDNKWPGPYGKMTLQVSLWTPHAYWAEHNVKVDDYVLLRNLRIKLSPDARLEGALHTDKVSPERIDVSVLKSQDDDRVKEVLRRKRDYWKKAEMEQGRFLSDVSVEKRRLDEGEVAQPKGKNKRRKKQQRQEEIKKNTETVQTRTSDKHALNKHIRSNYLGKPTSSIIDILNSERREVTTSTGVKHVLPFQNACYRASVRVVDFYPSELEDFAVPCKINEYDALSDSGNGSSDSEVNIECRGDMRWEWRFYLLVEDDHTPKGIATGHNRERVKILVADHDAEMLLKMNAENLRKNPTALAELKEKLFILWGDLEERKSYSTSVLQSVDPNKNRGVTARDHKQPTKPGPTIQQQCSSVSNLSGKAFECCLKEYGVRVSQMEGPDPGDDDEDGNNATGWERRFRMFGTMIL